MTLTAHYNAFKALLAGGILSGKVHDGVRLNRDGSPVRDNYAVLMPTTPRLLDGRFMEVGDASADATYRFDVRYVGTTVAAVLMWQDAGRARVLGKRLSVADRNCGPIRAVDGVEEDIYRRDQSADLFYVDETYEFVSWRA